MNRGQRSSGREDSSEEDEFNVEDLNEESSNSNTNKLASNWKNRFKWLRNYSTLDNSTTVSVGNNRRSSRTSGARRNHCYGYIIHPDNWSVVLILQSELFKVQQLDILYLITFFKYEFFET